MVRNRRLPSLFEHLLIIYGKRTMTNNHNGTYSHSNSLNILDTPLMAEFPAHDHGIINLKRSGELFMYCVWTQGVMASFVVLAQNPSLQPSFVEYHKQLSNAFVHERTELLHAPFSSILKDFHKHFEKLIKPVDNDHLVLLSRLRDLFAHGHLSLGRRYLLWGPLGSFNDRIRAFDLKPDPSSAHQLVKFDGADNTVYLKCISVVQQLDQGLFSRVAEDLGIDYQYVR